MRHPKKAQMAHIEHPKKAVIRPHINLRLPKDDREALSQIMAQNGLNNLSEAIRKSIRHYRETAQNGTPKKG
jgi:predicted DNA binding CopG/RHH family protein